VLVWNNGESEWQPSDVGTPGAHASTHENGGGDEISVADLSGELADEQKIKSAAPALTLGTSNVDGAAQTGIASNATIAAFDATVPTTIEPDDAAAAGSVAKAARETINMLLQEGLLLILAPQILRGQLLPLPVLTINIIILLG